jgi:hypothetical protein
MVFLVEEPAQALWAALDFRAPSMPVEVLFLGSVQGFDSRTSAIADKLKAARADVDVRVASPAETAALLSKWKLKYGPAIIIDGRVEFVGIPRLRTLLDRIDIVLDRKLHPPPAQPVAPPSTPIQAPNPASPASNPPKSASS